MNYKYYLAGSPIMFTSASQQWIDDFDANLNWQWDNASDLFWISEESSFASGSYINVQTRINRGINSYTGTKLGDDWKLLLFKDRNHNVDIGLKYQFSDSFWLTINTERLKNLACSVLVRRCNNVLRWMSTSGSEIYSEPCAIEYDISGVNNDVSSDNIVTPNGMIKVYVQQNSKTNTITENMRFLFGNPTNWVAYRVTGGGLRNFLNSKTYDNSSSQLMVLRMETSYTNDVTDDLVNGIADRYLYSTSGSSTAVANIVITPNDGTILEGDSQTFDVRYYSGSTVLSGSFIFAVSGSMVPNSNYTFSTLSGNTFNVTNNEMYLDYPLNILCSGSSGSRIFEISLAGEW